SFPTRRSPDLMEDRDHHAEAFGAEPVQPAQREFAALIRRQPARARKQAPPVLLGDLAPAIGPTMALLLEGLIGVRQQAVAIGVVGVMGHPAVFDNAEAEVGV